jgi:hypothetical protein
MIFGLNFPKSSPNIVELDARVISIDTHSKQGQTKLKVYGFIFIVKEEFTNLLVLSLFKQMSRSRSDTAATPHKQARLRWLG